MITAAHCLEFLFFKHNASSGLAALWVAAGSDHDLRSIYCNKFFDRRGIRMCDFQANHTHTKKVVKMHMHPKYQFNLKNFDEFRSHNDVALLEVQPFDLSEEINILPGCLFESDDNWFDDNLLVAGLFCTLSFQLVKGID